MEVAVWILVQSVSARMTIKFVIQTRAVLSWTWQQYS